jgi:hypothetical protein
MVSIRGLDKARVLMALYENAKVQGMEIIHYRPGPLPYEEAVKIVGSGVELSYQPPVGGCQYVDYLRGRVMMVDLSGDEFNPRLYDRDNGEGLAQAVVDEIIAQALEDVAQQIKVLVQNP